MFNANFSNISAISWCEQILLFNLGLNLAEYVCNSNRTFHTDSELMERFNNFNNVMKQWQEIVWFFGPGEHKMFLEWDVTTEQSETWCDKSL